MASRPPPPSLDHVIEALADKIADRVADRVAVRLAAGDGAGGWYDQHRSPIGKRRFLDAARRGEFESVKRGKLVLARREVVDAWLAAQVRDCEAENDHESGGDDVDALLVRAGVVSGTPRSCKPVRRR